MASTPRGSIGMPATRGYAKRPLHDDVGLARSPRRVARLAFGSRREVVAASPRGRSAPAAIAARPADAAGSGSYSHDDAVERVGEPIGIVRHDNGDGIAGVARAVAGEHGMTWRRPRGSGTSGGTVGASSGSSLERPHGEHAVERRAPLAVDSAHPRVSVGTADQSEVEQVRRADVVEVAAASGDEAGVFLPLERGADAARAS